MTLNRFGAHLEKYQPATLPAMTRCWQAMQNWVIQRIGCRVDLPLVFARALALILVGLLSGLYIVSMGLKARAKARQVGRRFVSKIELDSGGCLREGG